MEQNFLSNYNLWSGCRQLIAEKSIKKLTTFLYVEHARFDDKTTIYENVKPLAIENFNVLTQVELLCR